MADSGCSPEVTEDSEDISINSKPLVNGHFDETQLQRKLSLLCPDHPVINSKHLPLYHSLGDEDHPELDDHPGRALIRDAISPSPRQDERRRAEQILFFDLGSTEWFSIIAHLSTTDNGRRLQG